MGNSMAIFGKLYKHARFVDKPSKSCYTYQVFIHKRRYLMKKTIMSWRKIMRKVYMGLGLIFVALGGAGCLPVPMYGMPAPEYGPPPSAVGTVKIEATGVPISGIDGDNSLGEIELEEYAE
jgi:hypothetical protein